jgi:hypothetical protein
MPGAIVFSHTLLAVAASLSAVLWGYCRGLTLFYCGRDTMSAPPDGVAPEVAAYALEGVASGRNSVFREPRGGGSGRPPCFLLAPVAGDNQPLVHRRCQSRIGPYRL